MSDLIAGLLALLLLLLALALIATLQYYRRRREQERASHFARGRRIIAEIPVGAELVTFAEDDFRFFYGETTIEKEGLRAVGLLVNGHTIAEHRSPGLPRRATSADTQVFATEGISDRWDVAVETSAGSIVIECGAIRDRVSQELARTIYERLKTSIDHHSISGTPA